MSVAKLRIWAFLGLKDLEVELGKTVLYGPNATGKSRTIYSLLYVLNREALFEKLRLSDIELGSSNYAIVSRNGNEVQVKGDKLSCGEFGIASYESLRPCVQAFFRDLGIAKFSWMADDGTFIEGVTAGSYGFAEPLRRDGITRLLESAEEVEELAPHWSAFTSARSYYCDRVKVGGGWIQPHLLSTGERKVMAIQYFAKRTDIVLVEAFEGGLHADLALDLLDWLSEHSRYAIIETHLGLIIPEALDRGWTVYYFGEGRKFRVSYEELGNIELFKEELRAYRAIA